MSRDEAIGEFGAAPKSRGAFIACKEAFGATAEREGLQYGMGGRNDAAVGKNQLHRLCAIRSIDLREVGHRFLVGALGNGVAHNLFPAADPVGAKAALAVP